MTQVDTLYMSLPIFFLPGKAALGRRGSLLHLVEASEWAGKVMAKSIRAESQVYNIGEKAQRSKTASFHRRLASGYRGMRNRTWGLAKAQPGKMLHTTLRSVMVNATVVAGS